MRILNPMPPYNLFGVEDPGYDKAKVVVLPVPYDSTTSYKAGARDGPHAIIDASRSVELYSEELGQDVTKIGIHTLEEITPNVDSPKKMVESIAKEIEIIAGDKKVPIILGGEHTVAVGGIMGVSKTYKDFSVLHFDAHSDDRDEYEGSKYSHACIMARAREVTKSCYQVGIRSIDEDNAKKYSKDILYRKDMHDMTTQQVVDQILKRTKKDLYITLDLDVIDGGEFPASGTPEPDGIHFWELTRILKGVLKERNLIGMDFVELAPINGMIAPNFLVAKLIYLTLGYAFLQ